MYLGEITCNLLLALVDTAPKPVLFNGKSTKHPNKHHRLVMVALTRTLRGK
jgi:hexokinase